MLLCGRDWRRGGVGIVAADADLLLQRRLERNCIWFWLFGWNFLDTLRIHDSHMIASNAAIRRILIIRVKLILIGIVICVGKDKGSLVEWVRFDQSLEHF